MLICAAVEAITELRRTTYSGEVGFLSSRSSRDWLIRSGPASLLATTASVVDFLMSTGRGHGVSLHRHREHGAVAADDPAADGGQVLGRVPNSLADIPVVSALDAL